MSTKVTAWVYEVCEATGNDRLILLAIADEADDNGSNAFPSMARIAHKARVNDRTTRRCIERLEETGELFVLRPEKRGRGLFNRYVVLMGRSRDEGAQVLQKAGQNVRPAQKETGGKGRTPSQTVVDPLTRSSSSSEEVVGSLFEESPSDSTGEPPKKLRRPTKRNAMAAAFVKALGWNEPLPASASLEVNVAVKRLREQLEVTDPDLVHSAVATYRRQWPNWHCSPQSVVSHWHELRLPKRWDTSPMPADPNA